MEFLFSFIFFISLNTNAQDFEYYYEKATEDYENGVINSPFYDKALETCPDVKKHPRLLIYKGLDLYFSNQNILAVKYLELAKLYTTNDEESLNITYNLSLIYSELGQHTKANLYLKENLKKATELGNEFYKTESTFNILIEEYLNAEIKPSSNKFWDFYKTLNNKSNDDKFLYINSFYECINEEKLFDESKEIKKHIYNNFNIDSIDIAHVSFFHSNNALLSIGLKEYKKAIKYNDSSYFISKKLGLNDILAGLEIYKEIYEKDNKLEIALKYVDSIQIIEEKLKATNIKTSLETVDENILFNKTHQLYLTTLP